MKDSEPGLKNETFYKNIFYNYYKILVLYSVSIVKDISLAEDIVQDFFVKCWTKNLLRDIETLDSYLFLSIKNASYNALRNNLRYTNRIIKAGSDPLIEVYHEDKHFRSEAEESYSKIFDSISKLPQTRRKIFELYYYKSLKYKEIAELMGISANTVKVQLSRAIKFLRENSFFFVIP